MENPEIENQTCPVNALRRVIARLRGPGGCPWDREQTPASIVRFLLEEAYELVDAIAADHGGHVCEELGDVLFQVLFIAHVYAEEGEFDLDAVCRMIIAKMERRHPHVFGSARVADSAEVIRNWQQIKQKEKSTAPASVLDTVPAGLPALLRAYAVSERAAHANFDWPDVPGVVVQLDEEVAEFKAAVARQDADQMNRELGDILFTLVNVARLSGAHPETALSAAVHKFERRFRRMEKIISDEGRELESVSQSEKDAIWDGIKSDEEPSASP